MSPSSRVRVAAFYQFKTLPDAAAMRDRIAEACDGLKGTVLVAEEGVNGTVAGPAAGIDGFVRQLQGLGFDRLELKFAWAAKMPFHRLKVKQKAEIVTLGLPGLDPEHNAGEYVNPEDWNDVVSDPEVLLIDTRNRYESSLGTFDGAVLPETEAFRDFPQWVKTHLDPEKHRRVAMFCTGGIRCEKSTALLNSLGFEQVVHLRGGILNYLEKVDPSASRWQGECFVFDDRVSVDHQLKPGGHEQCFNCRMPLTAEDMASECYEKHVSCPHCHHRVDARRRAGLKERARQMALAEARGEVHLGQSFDSPEAADP